MKRKFFSVTIVLILTAMLFTSCDCGTESEPPVPEPTVALQSSSSSMVIGEIIQTDLSIKAIPEIAGVGIKLVYDPYKLEIVEITRDDSWLASEGGTVQQMELTTNNDQGYAKIVLAVFPTSMSVGDEEDVYHTIADIRVKALSAGSASLSISIDNGADSDLGIFKANGNLWSDIVRENLSLSVTS